MANTITISDGTTIYYKDWGSESGQPIVFSHSWPLDADAFEDQMFFLATHGYCCIGHDHRGHGRSSQPWDGNDLATYADDLAALLEELELDDVILVGHSTGGGEVVRPIGRQGNALGPLLQHQSIFRNGPDRGFEGDRRAYAGHPRR